ncbi:hypothetical protein K3495_g13816 [Podosphaera aphanis]|nr:hypothetical protein K3495_g13816 [Podosphaera aphanis]
MADQVNSQSPRGEISNFGKKIDLRYGKLAESDLNGFIAWRIAVYQDRRYRDYSLWEAFVEDFEGFTRATFEIASKDSLRKLRDFLRANGIFVFKQVRIPIANELYKVVIEEERHIWTEKEIEDQMSEAQGLNSSLTTLSNSIIRPFQPRIKIQHPTKEKNDPLEMKPQVSTYGREFSNLMKMYDDKLKYSGSKDSFDYKLTIFYDPCSKAGLYSDAYSISFSTMLRDDVLDYFYDSVNNQGLSFEAMCSMVKSHIETDEHKQAMMTIWNSMFFKSIIKQNEEKQLLDCFEIFFENTPSHPKRSIT